MSTVNVAGFVKQSNRPTVLEAASPRHPTLTYAHSEFLLKSVISSYPALAVPLAIALSTTRWRNPTDPGSGLGLGYERYTHHDAGGGGAHPASGIPFMYWH
jgi:hypothetical protein